MFSQEVWAIEELVRLICSHTLEYTVLSVWQDGQGHDGIVLNGRSRRTLAKCILFLNHFISRITAEVLWKDIDSLKPLYDLLPCSYYSKEVEAAKGWEDLRMREGIPEDFDRFCEYSTHIRYLQATDGALPNEVLEDYMRLFPDRPLPPRVRSINFEMDTASWLRYLLRSLTLTKNQPYAYSLTLRSLSIYRSPYCNPWEEEGQDLARNLAAFQRLNGRLGGGLEVFRDFMPFPDRGRFHLPAGYRFQEVMENAFSLPPPETTGAIVHGLRRLEVTHYLREFPAFFERVARMHALEHLKIAIAYEPHIGEMGEEVGMESNFPKVSRKDRSPNDETTRHSASSLEIEGRWSELSLSLSLCAPPSKVTRFRTLRLLYYLPRDSLVSAQGVRLLDLPADTIPPDSLEALTVNLLENGDKVPNPVPDGIEWVLKVDTFRPLLRYKQMVELHLELPYNIMLDIDFLRALAAVMCKTIRHLVVLRRLDQWEHDDFRPALTANDLPTIVGVLMPGLQTLGLDVSYDGISASSKRDTSVAPPVLQTLYVGTITLKNAQVPEVARFLKEYFPSLQSLYHHEKVWEAKRPWSRLVSVNKYSDGKNGRWCGLPWGYRR